jgi:hypothetical protein
MKRTLRSMAGILILLIAVGALTWAAGPGMRAMGYLTLGLNRVDPSDFQARLDRTGLGYPRQPRDHLAVGGGGLFCARRLVVGLEGLALFSPDRAGQGYRTSLSGACGVFQVGYALVSSEGFSLYPLLGFGGGAFTWKVQEDVVPGTFEDVIRHPEMGTSLLNASFLVQAALGADVWLPIGRPGGAGRLVLGVRAGYAYSAFGHNWEVQMYDRTLELEGAPQFGINGPFVRLVAGWGGQGRNGT